MCGLCQAVVDLPEQHQHQALLRRDAQRDILDAFALYPNDPTFANYVKIFTDPSWYSGYINSITYVSLNTLISLTVALPAAYAFSRYRFIGDKHMFFWLLTNDESNVKLPPLNLLGYSPCELQPS